MKHSNEPVYRLHIGALPVVGVTPPTDTKEAASSATHAASEKKITLKAKIPPPRVVPVQKRPTWLSKLLGVLEFAGVSTGVFIAIYVVLNWSALSVNIEHYWNVLRGFKSPLEKLVAENPAIPERLLSASAAGGGVIVIPPLNLEVFPTDTRVVIPRINTNVPVIGVKNENLIAQRWEALEADIQKALRNGVVHYPGTALPGENGNVVITGHSSYYAWDPGRFKDVFALLHDVRHNDRIVVYFNQKKFIYEVTNIKVVLPKDIDVLAQSSTEKLTLITCTPIGTNLKRLIIEAKLVEKS